MLSKQFLKMHMQLRILAKLKLKSLPQVYQKFIFVTQFIKKNSKTSLNPRRSNTTIPLILNDYSFFQSHDDHECQII